MSVYAMIGANDCDKSHTFYDAVLATINWKSHDSFPGARGYSEGGAGKGFQLWVATPFNKAAATSGNGSMIGFSAKSHREVDEFYSTAMAEGGSDEGAPGLRPHYGPKWYAAYLRDPAGNKIAVVCNE